MKFRSKKIVYETYSVPADGTFFLQVSSEATTDKTMRSTFCQAGKQARSWHGPCGPRAKVIHPQPARFIGNSIKVNGLYC